MSITLYAAKMSSASPVVQAVHELQAPVEIVWIDLAKKEQRSPEFLARNPNGKVPTLVVDGAPMFEAQAILCYLGERFGVERGLWPAAGSGDRLAALSWSSWAYVSYGAQLTRLVYAGEQMPSELQHPAQVAAARREIGDLLRILDERLAKQPYLLGQDFSLVDLIVGCTVTYGTFVGASVDGYRNIEAWLGRFRERASYKATWLTAG